MSALSERLRDANRDAWAAMQRHRFVCEIEADALPADVFHRYLRYEHRFVAISILIFGHALLQAPDMAARRFLCGVLHGLGGEQLDYFDRVFASLGLVPHGPEEKLPDAVVALDRGMLTVAERGAYLDTLTIMLAAEWMYATWCGRAHRRQPSYPPLADWVRLHAEPAFLAQADWLRAQIDAAAAQVDATTFKHLVDLFDQTLRLEIDFHAAAYEEPRS